MARNFAILCHKAGVLPIGVPAVKKINDATIQLLSTSLILVPAALALTTFWEYVRSLNVVWMWYGIVNEGEDIFYLVNELRNGYVFSVTDRPYNKKYTPQVTESASAKRIHKGAYVNTWII